MQSRKHSLIEAFVNTAVGFCLSCFVAYAVLPYFGMKKSFLDSFEITVIFTVISILRNYFVRRFFNFVWSKYEFKY